MDVDGLGLGKVLGFADPGGEHRDAVPRPWHDVAVGVPWCVCGDGDDRVRVTEAQVGDPGDALRGRPVATASAVIAAASNP
jgi:hypothetical protein